MHMVVISTRRILIIINISMGRQYITIIVIVPALLFSPAPVFADSAYYYVSFSENVKNGVYSRSDLNLIKENEYFSFIKPQKIIVKGTGKDVSQAKFDAIAHFLANEDFFNVQSKVLTSRSITVEDVTKTSFEGVFSLPGRVLNCDFLEDKTYSCVFQLSYKKINSLQEKKADYWKRKLSAAKKFFYDMVFLP